MVPETPRKPADPATDGHPGPHPGQPVPATVTSADHHQQRPICPQNSDTPNFRRLIRYRPNVAHVRKMHPKHRPAGTVRPVPVPPRYRPRSSSSSAHTSPTTALPRTATFSAATTTGNCQRAPTAESGKEHARTRSPLLRQPRRWPSDPTTCGTPASRPGSRLASSPSVSLSGPVTALTYYSASIPTASTGANAKLAAAFSGRSKETTDQARHAAPNFGAYLGQPLTAARCQSPPLTTVRGQKRVTPDRVLPGQGLFSQGVAGGGFEPPKA